MMPAWSKQGTDSVDDAVITLLSTGDPSGYTSEEIIDTLHLSVGADVLQHHLEDLVDAGVLDRHGIGRGALYTLLPADHHLPAPATPLSQAGQMHA